MSTRAAAKLVQKHTPGAAKISWGLALTCNSPHSPQNLEIRFTAGPSVADNNYHVPIVRGQLTRNLALLLADIRDEIAHAFADEIPPTDGACPCWPSLARVVLKMKCDS